MEFHSDIKLLYKQFAEFSDTALIGVGPDLSPHYRLNLEQFRRWFPDSTLGDPGLSQVGQHRLDIGNTVPKILNWSFTINKSKVYF